MKTHSQKQLEKYSLTELEMMLKSIKDMIFFPLQNNYNLSKKELKEMKKDVENRIIEIK
tara:strand:- start:887 stop:1063 length:177 start_codon:yes stop_codon:yes gene_type:complete